MHICLYACIYVFGFRSDSAALLVRVTPGRHGVAPRQLRAVGPRDDSGPDGEEGPDIDR